MTAIVDIRNAIAANITTDVITCYAHAPSEPSPPCAYLVGRDPYIDYHIAQTQQLFRVNLQIVLVASLILAEESQLRLDGWLGRGAGSVAKAIEDDKTLGGIVQDVVVRTGTAPDVFTVGRTDYAMAAVDIEVLTK